MDNKENTMATIDFAAIAKSELTLSPVMEGREKKTVEEIIAAYPDGFTLTEFDIVTTYSAKKHADQTYPVFAIKENDAICFFGGCILMKLAAEWANACGGDIQAASKGLSACGGVKVKMYTKKTTEGNNLTAVKMV